MGNTISVGKKGVIEQIFSGDQSYGSVHQVTEELEVKIEEFKKKKKEIKVLVNLSDIGKTNTGSRRASVEALKNLEYDKIAIFGGSNYIIHLSRFVVMASGKNKKVKVFKERKDAINWLKKKEI